MSNSLLTLVQLPLQPASSELGVCKDSSLDPVQDGLHAAKAVVVGEAELRWCFVALPDNRVTAVPLALDLPPGGYCQGQGTFVGKSCRIMV
jgi:hypothetical protein